MTNDNFFMRNEIGEIISNYFKVEFPELNCWVRFDKNNKFSLTVVEPFLIKQNGDLKYYEFIGENNEIVTRDIDFDFYHVFDTFYPYHSKDIEIYFRELDIKTITYDESITYSLIFIDRK